MFSSEFITNILPWTRAPRLAKSAFPPLSPKGQRPNCTSSLMQSEVIRKFGLDFAIFVTAVTGIIAGCSKPPRAITGLLGAPGDWRLFLSTNGTARICSHRSKAQMYFGIAANDAQLLYSRFSRMSILRLITVVCPLLPVGGIWPYAA